MEVAVQTRAFRAQLSYLIDDESKVGEARRAAQALALYEFDQATAGRVAIVATELANNLFKHSGGGTLLIQMLGSDETAVLEIIALDRGPGIANVERCLTDGYSTAGSPGTGLGAVRRLSDEFDIYSNFGEGTIVLSRIGGKLAVRFGAVNLALHGEIECGDGWNIQSEADQVAVVVVDGLGHGSFAAEAARQCIGAFVTAPYGPPSETLLRANVAMGKTRGGAAAVALLHPNGVSYSGIGNISGTLLTAEKSQGMVSHNGTLGTAGVRRPAQFEYPRAPGTLLVMHSDGIGTRWDLKTRPDLLMRHPAIIAALLYRDHTRDRDDATVVVVAT
jgi:anti-sigma regulatory factor (Ser/Thr protein kinase)